MTTEPLRYAFLSTSVGRVLLVVSSHGIRSLRLADGDDDAALLDSLRAEDTAPLVQDPRLRREWSDRIEDVLVGEQPSTSLPLDLVGTPFQVSVWKALCEIPYGETRTYAEVAELIGSPKAVRAVGSACGRNRIGLIVPCHRVLRQGGDVGFWGSAHHATLQRLMLDRERTADEALVS